MNKNCVRFLLTSFVLWSTSLLSASSSASDWPQYRGVAGDGISSETVPSQPWGQSGPKIAWKTPTSLGFSSLSVAHGKAFTLVSAQGREMCVALNAATGETLWQTPLGKSQYQGGGNAGAAGNRGGDGPRSTPAVDGDRVYVYGADMQLFCLNAETGQTVWQHDIIKEYAGRNISWQNASSPVLDDTQVFVSGGGEGESFLAFDKLSGKLKWKSGDESYTHATPTLATIQGKKQLVFFVQSGLVAINPQDGAELWRTPFPYSVSTAASPVVSGNQVYCSAGYGVGASLFEIQPNGNVDEVWSKPNKLMNHWSTPVVHDGHLYGIFEFKKYGRAPLQCVELATGKIKWSKRGYGPGNCILAGDKLIALSDSGEVVIVALRNDQYEEIARADVLDGKCWSMPAIANGKIYVRSTEEAACIDLAL